MGKVNLAMVLMLVYYIVIRIPLEGHEMIDMTYTTDPADYVQMELTPLAQWTE